MHISAIREARNLEISTLKKSEKAFQPNSDKKDRKFPLLSAEKKELDKRFNTISQRVESFSPIHKDFCGKHIRFDPSSSEDEGRDDYLSEENDENNDHVTGSQVNFSSQSVKSSDRVSSCPYPSVIEERRRLGLSQLSPASGSQKHNDSSGSVKKKRKSENINSAISMPHKLRKRDKVQDALPMENGRETNEVSNLHENDLSIDNNDLRMFITTWKEACLEYTVDEVCSCSSYAM